MRPLRRAAVLAFTLGLAAAYSGCKGRPTGSAAPASSAGTSARVTDGKVAEIDLTGSVPESMAAGGFLPLPATRTYTGLVRAIERAAAQPDVAGFFIRLGADERLNWAQAEELGRTFEALRKRGKPVVCHAHGYANTSIGFAARACDRVWLSPGGSVDSVGIAAQVVYMKSALDKLKVSFDVLHIGKYKAAAEPLTRDGPSDEARESLTGTLASIRKTWLDSASAARKTPELRHKLEHGPWGAQEAKAQGLVDALGFESEAREDAKKRAGVSELKTTYGSGAQSSPGLGIADVIRLLAGADEHSGGRDHIAVLVAEGSISLESESSPFGGGGIAERAMTRTLKKLADNDSVKAVVLRIDSPGGSALASDLIWHAVSELRKKKPVIASVGSMAASGGFYLACGASRIVAERTSIVGSIGVVGGKLVLDAALAEWGVNAVTMPASPEPGAAARAAYLSPFAAWDEPTRQRVRAHMLSIYELFLDRCAEGRKLSKDKLRESAEGRVWSGEQGKERGLIDEFGGMARALELARTAAGLDSDVPVVVEGARESLLETLMLGEDASAAEIASALEKRHIQQARAALAGALPRELLQYARALEPLARGETVSATLPYALWIE